MGWRVIEGKILSLLLSFLVVMSLLALITQNNISKETFATSSSVNPELVSYLECMLLDAQMRSQHYENISFIFKPVEFGKDLVDKYLSALYSIAKLYVEKVDQKIGLRGAFEKFYELLREYGWEALKELLYDSASDFSILKGLNIVNEFLLPHECVGLVYDAANKIRDILVEATDRYVLTRAYKDGVERVDYLISGLSSICKGEINTINDIVNGGTHVINLRAKLDEEVKQIDKVAKNVRRLLEDYGGEITKERNESFAVFLGELAQFKAYLLTILNSFLPYFEISVDKNVITLSETGSALLLINIVSKNAFEGDVSLSLEWVDGKPAWVTKEEFKPQIVALKAYTCAFSTLNVAVSDFAREGEYAFRVVGKCDSASSYKVVKFSIGKLGSVRAELSISPKVVEVNQSVSIEIKAYFENGSLVKNAAVNAWVIRPDSSRRSVLLNYDTAMHKFIGEYGYTDLPGTYRFYADVGKLFYAPHEVSDSFVVQKFSYNLGVYAIEDYDYRLTSNLTYPYDLNEITSIKGVKYKVTVVGPFEDGFFAKVWKDNEEIYYDILREGDFMFFDSKELLVYVSRYLYSNTTNSAYLMLQLGVKTGRANINTNTQTVEAGTSCEFTITTSATDRYVVYVYGEPRLWASFPGITWATINDYQKLQIKELYASAFLPSTITLRITPPPTTQPAEYNFWLSVMRSPTSRLNDGMNPGDLFLVSVTITPTQHKVTLTSSGTKGEKNFGSIVLDGTTYVLYQDVIVTKYQGSYSITMIPPQGYSFTCWNTTGQITVENVTAESTTLSITGDGIIEGIISPILGNITGRVVDHETKRGVKSVICWSPCDPPWDPRFSNYEGFLCGYVSTDDNGYFQIIDIPSWTYDVGVSAEGYFLDIYGFSWKNITVIPYSSVTVYFELISYPQLIIQPDTLSAPQGSECNFTISTHPLEEQFLDIIYEVVGEFSIMSYYGEDLWEIPEELRISPEHIIVEPYGVFIDPKGISNFSTTFSIYVSANATLGTYCIPIALCIYAEVPVKITYVIVQVVSSNAAIQNIELAEQTFDIVIETNSTEISNFAFDKSTKTITYEVSGPNATIGYCNVTIPKMLMDAPFSVSVNGEQVEYNMTENSIFYFVYFTYQHSHETIQISSPKLLGDSEPPIIIPLTDQEELLTADQNLTIYAFAMDFDHEIDRIWLLYSMDDGLTWSGPIDMKPQLGHIYQTQITGLKEGDLVKYKIIAEDQAGNTAESEPHQVQVIPEYSSPIIVSILMLITLTATILLKTRRKSDPNYNSLSR